MKNNTQQQIKIKNNSREKKLNRSTKVEEKLVSKISLKIGIVNHKKLKKEAEGELNLLKKSFNNDIHLKNVPKYIEKRKQNKEIRKQKELDKLNKIVKILNNFIEKN